MPYTSTITFSLRIVRFDTGCMPSNTFFGDGTVKGKKGSKRRGMTKADLVDVVYERHGGLTKNEAAEIVEAIFATVKTTLGDGRPVRIKNFGSFEVTKRAGREGVNPTSGEKIFIPPHRGLNFRPARRLRTDLGPEGSEDH